LQIAGLAGAASNIVRRDLSEDAFILFHLALAELISSLHAYALFHLNHTLL
jgi:hypothetical protein